ncbi:hypothetical protein [Streptomyces sp. 3N207]|uniref:hypothetical protein n=1 Tax=Streptomyces sp. 3N207 TaxID=3457417 RepID=UPI003FD5B092
MPVVYCRRWNYQLSQPIDELSEVEARDIHLRGEPYTAAAVTLNSEHPDRVLEIALRSGHVRVHFLGEYGRVETILTFRPSGELLFLREIRGYEYDGQSQEYLALFEAERLETDEFNEDGTGLETVKDKKRDEYYTVDLHLKETSGLQSHYEPIPQFGDYASIARPFREEPPVPFG